jgi:hypothetical protein
MSKDNKPFDLVTEFGLDQEKVNEGAVLMFDEKRGVRLRSTDSDVAQKAWARALGPYTGFREISPEIQCKIHANHLVTGLIIEWIGEIPVIGGKPLPVDDNPAMIAALSDLKLKKFVDMCRSFAGRDMNYRLAQEEAGEKNSGSGRSGRSGGGETPKE